MCIKKIIGLPISLLLFLPENNSPCLFALVWLLQWSRKSPQPHYSTFLPLLLSPDLAFFPGFEDLEDVDSPDVVESLTPLNPPYVVKNLDIEPLPSPYQPFALCQITPEYGCPFLIQLLVFSQHLGFVEHHPGDVVSGYPWPWWHHSKLKLNPEFGLGEERKGGLANIYSTLTA